MRRQAFWRQDKYEMDKNYLNNFENDIDIFVDICYYSIVVKMRWRL